MSTSYAALLERHGFAVRTSHPWASVGDVARSQGWKLHLSSIPTEAPRLLRRVLPVLQSPGSAFKVVIDGRLLGLLNEGLLGDTQVGKFATIYPDSDVAARTLAERLVEATRGFHGPIVATDMRLGDVVYARYGGFNSVVLRDRLGGHVINIRDRDGHLTPDEYTVPFAMPAGRRNPFAGLLARSGLSDSGGRHDQASGMLGPGFLVLEVVKPHPKGSIYRGLDLRQRKSMAICILKEGRQWCLADRQGRDIRSRLRHQAKVHAELRGRVPIPEAGEYFEAEGHGYLPLEFIPGRTLVNEVLRELRSRPWGSLALARRQRLLGYLIETIDAVQRMHDAGYVHRDLTAANVLIRDDGRVFLLDLELAHRLDDPSPPFDSGTPGFVSPQQLARRRPTTADDVHALGALILLTLTGLDPRRPRFAGPNDRVHQWTALTAGAAPRIVEIAARCLDRKAESRPSLAEVREIVVAESSASSAADRSDRAAAGATAGPRAHTHTRAVTQGLHGLLRHTLANSAGLWLSQPFERHPGRVGTVKAPYELRRSANRGVAGVLYVLGRLARFGHRTPEATDRARRAAAWLLAGHGAPDSGMPGLHFGDAGVAVALAEAAAGDLVKRSARLDSFVRSALDGVVDWPDLTHGAAGQGIAALYCADRLGDRSLSSLSARSADYLIRSQRPAGHWAWPDQAPSSTKGTWTGFAHGVAGITYFLAEYARRFSDAAAERAWRRGAAWLLRRADRSGSSMTWPNRIGEPDRWAWWCHGSIGISLLFLRLHEQTGEARFAEVAQRALRVHPPAFLAENLSQCHGHAGAGEAYLEAARVLGGRQWHRRAHAVRDTLWNLRRSSRNGASTWFVEGAEVPTADLMVGGSGIVHFLLRASLAGAHMGPPLLLDPIATG